MANRAWVTLATNDSYALGALVLAHSLRKVNSVYPAIVLITPSVTENMRGRLSGVFAEVITVDVLDSQDAAHLALLARPELGITFTKIHCWSLTQYEKCVFLDADTLVLQNSDELLEREELSAAPDVGWPDCFNSGVFVYRPSEDTFTSLLEFAKERGSFDGGDQGLLNSYFSSWARGDINKHLPFIYNVTSIAFYSYLPALKEFGQDVKIVHFIGNAKPWLQSFNWQTRAVTAEGHVQSTLQLWWDIFVSSVHPQLDQTMTGLAGTLSRLTLGSASIQQTALDEHTRRQGWEAGNIDYLGADSFDNIWAKISDTLAQSPSKTGSESKPEEGEVPTIVKSEDPVESSIAAPSTEPTIPLQPAPVLESSETVPTTNTEVTTTLSSTIPASEVAPISSSVYTKTVTEVDSKTDPIAELSQHPILTESSTKSEVEPTESQVLSVTASEVPVVASSEQNILSESTVPFIKAIVVEPPKNAPVIENFSATTFALDDEPISKTTPIPLGVEAVSTKPSSETAPSSERHSVEPSSDSVQGTEFPSEKTISELTTPNDVKTVEASKSETPTNEAVSQSTLPTPSIESPSEVFAKTENENLVTAPGTTTPVSESLVEAAAPPQLENPPTLTPESSPAKSIEVTPEKGIQEQASTDSPPLLNTPVKDSVSPKSNEEGAQETRL